LPNGGGAIRGIDEKLTVDQPSGTAKLGVLVFTSPGREFFGRQLTLSYDSRSGNGPYGTGCNLGVPAVTRKTSIGLPRYQDAIDSDLFVLAGEELAPVPRDVQPAPADSSGFAFRAYHLRVETVFARVQRWESADIGEVNSRTASRENVTSLYGQDATSQITDPDDLSRAFIWLIDASFDHRGNAISYQHKRQDTIGVGFALPELGRKVTANRYPKHILYGNHNPLRARRDTTVALRDRVRQ
jgi:hypothetical protein